VHKKNLHLPLTAAWFGEIKSGRKNIDYRLCSAHWKSRIEGNTFDNVMLHFGYTSKIITRKWIKTEKLKTGIKTDLKVDKPVYAIYFDAERKK